MRVSPSWVVLAAVAGSLGACSILFDGSALGGGSSDAGSGGAGATDASTDTSVDSGGDASAGNAGDAGASEGGTCLPEGSPCADDGDPCTNDVCQGGVCAHPSLGAGSPCSATSVCDTTGACSQGCGIQGAFYAPGAENPADSCEVCDPSTSRSAWTSRADDTPCTDDGNVCTSDFCASGLCVHAPQATGSDCGMGKVCDDAFQCSAGCFIASQFVADGSVDPSDPCKGCDASQSTAGWVVRANGAACDDDGNACTVDECQNATCKHTPEPASTPCGANGKCVVFGSIAFCNASCSIGGKSYAEGTPSPANPCATCQTAVSTSSFSPLADGSSCGATSCTPFGACSYGDACATNGTQSRTCTDHVCSAGTCKAAPRDDPAACSRTTDGNACMDDGSACTGDVCAGGGCTHPKSAAGTSCGTGQICDGNGSCIAGCYISGAFYADGAPDPANPCRICSAASSTSSFSNKLDGARCGVINVCGANTCHAGSCTYASTCKGCCDGLKCYPGACP